MNRKRLIYALTLALGIIIAMINLASCGKKESSLLKEPYVKEINTMGTTVTVTNYTAGKSVEEAVDASLKIAEDYNTWITANQAGSVVDEINRNAGLAPVKVSSQIFELIQAAYNLSSQNTGYDVTIGPLTQLWRIGFSDEKLPMPSEIASVLPLIDHKYIELDEKKLTVYLTKKGTRLDLGSIAKGYTAKQMVTYLKAKGMTNGIVDLGSSSLYVIGHSPRGKDIPWNVGIKDPNNPQGDSLGILAVENQFVSTSGIYERYLTVNGKTYSHILDPKTGYPFENDIQSISIVGEDDPTYGDGVTTTVFSLGTEKGYDYVMEHRLQAIFVDKENKVYITPGLKDKFTLNSASKYKMAEITSLKESN